MFFLVRINPGVEPVSQSAFPIQDGNAQLMLHEVREPLPLHYPW